MTDILVLGGGLAGTCVAHRLRELGRSVVLVEARPRVGEGASYANGAMLTPSMAAPWNAPGVLGVMVRSFFDPGSPMKLRAKALPSLAGWGLQFLRNAAPVRHERATQRVLALASYSLCHHQALRAGFGTEFDAAASGTLEVYRDAQALAAARTVASRLEPFGLRHDLLDAEALIETEPQLAGIRQELAGGIRFPDDEVGDARKFTQCLARRFVALGGTIMTGCRVLRLIVQGGRVCGAETDREPVRAAETVLALGTDPDGIAARAGLRLPIRPAKGYSLTYDVTDLNAKPRIPVVDAALHAGVVPLGNRLRVVGTAEFAGHDDRISPERVGNLETLLAGIYPRLAPELFRRGGEAWAGFRPMSADGMPFVGPTHVPGLWVNMGHGHLGWTLATGSARLLADLVTGRTPEIDPTITAPNRQGC